MRSLCARVCVRVFMHNALMNNAFPDRYGCLMGNHCGLPYFGDWTLTRLKIDIPKCFAILSIYKPPLNKFNCQRTDGSEHYCQI